MATVGATRSRRVIRRRQQIAPSVRSAADREARWCACAPHVLNFRGNFRYVLLAGCIACSTNTPVVSRIEVIQVTDFR